MLDCQVQTTWTGRLETNRGRDGNRRAWQSRGSRLWGHCQQHEWTDNRWTSGIYHILCLFQYERQGIVGVEVTKYGRGKAFRNKWIGQDEKKKFVKQVWSQFVKFLIWKVDSIQDTTRQELLDVRNYQTTSPKTLADLCKRNLIEKKKTYYFSVEKGDKFTLDIKRQETDINVDMLQRQFPLPFIGAYASAKRGRPPRSNLITSTPWAYLLKSGHSTRS